MKQLIVVEVTGSRCKIHCYEKRSGQFRRAFAEHFGFVGRNGASRYKQEGDGKTPLGLFDVGVAFGKRETTATNLDYMQITHRTRWCCNSNSRYYNCPTDKRWLNNCEDMRKYRREYEYGFFIEYNHGADKVKEKGSAVFFHVSAKETAGCVGTDKFFMKKLLKWLNKKAKPHILITDAKTYRKVDFC